MKTARELAEYTHINQGAMRQWYSREFKHAETILERWAKECHLKDKKEDELVSDIAVYDLEGNVITQNYMVALLKCREEYTRSNVCKAVDIVLQEMAKKLSDHMRRLYPCLRPTHSVVMRANQKGQCVLYVGPFGKEESPTAFQLFGDGGVFMTEGLEACRSRFYEIELFR